MTGWLKHTELLKSIMDSLTVTGAAGEGLIPDSAFGKMKEMTLEIKREGRTIFFMGNGASASMASHIAADLEKNFHVCTEVFTDLSRITAIANDMGYDQVFAEPVRRKLRKGDMLVAISSSGKSPNILAAAREAAGLGGIIVTISAMSADNPLRSLGALNFHVRGDTFGLAETCHAAILHYWVDLMTGSGEQ